MIDMETKKLIYMAANTDEAIAKIASDDFVSDISVVLNCTTNEAKSVCQELIRDYGETVERVLEINIAHIKSMREKWIAYEKSKQTFYKIDAVVTVIALIGFVIYLIWNFA